MKFHHFALSAFLLSGMAAHADPVTYAGKLGASDIVVELTADPAVEKGAIAGRYFYRSKGVDIPLQARAHKGKTLQFAEEGPCTEETCGDGKPAPISAAWRLSVAQEGKTLRGTWQGKKSIGIELTRIGSRPADPNYDPTPYGLFSFSDRSFYDDTTPITRQSSPYDFLRLDMATTDGKTQGWPDASFRYVVDPRTKFATPRIVELAGNVPFEAANDLLRDRHWRASRSALSCMALAYAGFHEDGQFSDFGGGTLGGYEDSVSEVTALTPALMGWTETGSLYCGGAHPENYSSTYVMDVRRGVLLDFQDMLADVADGTAGDKLVAYVKANRDRPTDQTDIDFEKECGTDDLIANYLSVGLKRMDDGEHIVFGLEDLPHAIQACAKDLLDLPLAEARPLLTPQFAKLLDGRQ